MFVHKGQENLGIQYLSALLKERRYETALSLEPGLFSISDNVFPNPNIEKFFDKSNDIFEQIIKFDPDIVAFSVYTATYQWCCELAKKIKKNIETKVVFGGIHPTLTPENVIKNDFVDFVVMGEGEYAFLELVKALEFRDRVDDIKNLCFKQNGKIIKNKIREPMNVDLLPFPDKELFSRYVNYKDDYLILTSRGCLFNCAYCCEAYVNTIYEHRFFRRRSVDSVMDELNFMKSKYGFKEVLFDDAVLFTDKIWLKKLIKRYKNEINVPFKCFGQVLFLDEEVAELLKWGRCYNIEFGIQTMNDGVRKKVLNREENRIDIAKALRICDKYRIRYDIDHMFGLPCEKEKDFLESGIFYNQCKYLNRIKCHNLTYFPNLPIIEIAKKTGKLSEEEEKQIEEGKSKTNFFFLPKNIKYRNNIESIQNFYKILPLLNNSSVKFIIKTKIYKKFYLFPKPIILFMQFLVAFKGGDYRFFLYCKNYPVKIFKTLLSNIKYRFKSRTPTIGIKH